MSTLTRTLLKRAFNRFNGRESNERGQKESKEEGEKKVSILLFLYRRPLLSESYSLACRDGQRKPHLRAEVISIVFINLNRYTSGVSKSNRVCMTTKQTLKYAIV